MVVKGILTISFVIGVVIQLDDGGELVGQSLRELYLLIWGEKESIFGSHLFSVFEWKSNTLTKLYQSHLYN